jgi:hypothetical protein
VRTDDLIRELAADARPVRRLSPWLRRTALWTLVAAVCAVAVIVGVGTRRDLTQVIWRGPFVFEAFLLVVTAISAAGGALIVSVPGAERSRLVRWLPVVAGAGALLWVTGELAVVLASGEQPGRFVLSWWCIQRTLLVGLVPGILLFAMVGRGAPLRAAWAGLLALLATSALGVLGTNIMCSVDRPVHVLLWHVGPMAVLSAAGAFIGASVFDWMRGVRESPYGPSSLEQRH